MIDRASPARKIAMIVLFLVALAGAPAGAQTRQLTDEQIRTIEFHYKLDQYMVAGCILGATFGAVTGLMTLSGMSVIASVPYISTGCSLGFLIGPASMMVRDYLNSPPGRRDASGWHWPGLRD